MLTEPMRTFLGELVDQALAAERFDERQRQRQHMLETTVGIMTDGEKDAMRTAMNFYAVDAKGKRIYMMDPRGQEYSLDPERATRDKLTIDPAALDAARRQFELITAKIDKLKAATAPDGSPLYSASDLLEVYDSFVREGLLPEALLTDDNSRTAQLLGASFSRYRETLAEARQEKEQARAKAEADWHGAGSKTDMLTAAGKKAKDGVDQLMARLGPVGKTTEERQRSFNLTKSAVMDAISIYGGVSAAGDFFSGQALDSAKDTLAGIEDPSEPSTFFSDWGDRIADLFDKDPTRAGAVANALGDALRKAAAMLDEGKDLIGEITDSPEGKIAKTALKLLSEMATEVPAIGLSALELQKVQQELRATETIGELRRGAKEITAKIDLKVQAVMTSVHANAGAAVAGAFQKAVKVEELIAAVSEKPPECQQVIDAVAAGLRTCLRSLSKDDAGGNFARIGALVEKAFKAQAKAAAMKKAIEDEPGKAFKPLLAAAEQALQKGLGLLDDDPTEDSTAAAA
ncbi:MAG: hypothetical protein KDC98_09680, partial [Planctomycetes bacterium]|nr:hypothetical protein [Planctomycetota bacterium]